MAKTIPLASHEVRWFFEGKVDQHQSLKHWFETVAAIPKHADVSPPVWKDRLDVYLLVPASDDMGIKWREGELQIKGRISSLGTHAFCGRYQGKVERWIKWSYANPPCCVSTTVCDREGDGAGYCLRLEESRIAQGAAGHVHWQG